MRPDPLSDHLAHLRLRGLRPATIIQRRYAIRRLHRALGKEPLKASTEELDAWQRVLTMAPISRSCELTHVIGYFKWAMEDGRIRTDPTRRLIRPKRPPRLPRPIGETELRRALLLAPPQVRPWLALAAWAGLRAGEIARLQRCDVLEDATPPVLIVADGKGGRSRVIPIGPALIEELRGYGLPSRGVLFRRGDGKPGGHTPARLSTLANRHLHAVGISDTLHSLRHRYATVAYQQSQDLRLVGELLGHSDPATTAGYCAYSAAGAVKVALLIDASLVPGRFGGDAA